MPDRICRPPKMTPLVACFSGTVNVMRSAGVGGHNMLTIEGEDGFASAYMHINNDTPGTDDGLGTAEYAFPAGLQSGDHVEAGQLVAGLATAAMRRTRSRTATSSSISRASCLMQLHRFAPPATSRNQLPARSRSTSAGCRRERLDEIVRSLDTAKSVLCIDLTSTMHSNGSPVSVRKPERRWVRLADCRIVSPERFRQGVRNTRPGSRRAHHSPRSTRAARRGNARERLSLLRPPKLM